MMMYIRDDDGDDSRRDDDHRRWNPMADSFPFFGLYLTK